jgi:hypothetical protein
MFLGNETKTAHRAITILYRKRKRGRTIWTLLKMIDDLQTPKHKTNHK